MTCDRCAALEAENKRWQLAWNEAMDRAEKVEAEIARLREYEICARQWADPTPELAALRETNTELLMAKTKIRTLEAEVARLTQEREAARALIGDWQRRGMGECSSLPNAVALGGLLNCAMELERVLPPATLTHLP